MKKLILTFFICIMAVGLAHAEIPIYDDQGKRDPLWPMVTSTGALMSYDDNILISDMTLEGIIQGAGGENVAIINGVIVEQNHTLGNYTISKINRDSVEFIKDNESFVLKLKKED